MNVIIHGHGRINPQLNNKYVEKCILLGFTYMQEVRVCMCVCVVTTFMSLSTCACRSYPIPSFVFPCGEWTQVIFRSRVRPKKAYKSITKRCESKAAFFATQLTSADVSGVVLFLQNSRPWNHLKSKDWQFGLRWVDTPTSFFVVILLHYSNIC